MAGPLAQRFGRTIGELEIAEFKDTQFIGFHEITTG
jgi:hypothetical protein